MSNKYPTFKSGPDFVEGTVADLIGGAAESKLRINGKKVDQPAMSVLARLGIAQEVGVVERPEGSTKRGPAPKIYRLPLNGTFATVRK